MITALVAQTIFDLRRVLHKFFAAVDFAIEYPQRILLVPTPTIPAQLIELVTEVMRELLSIHRSTFRTADGVELQRQALEPELPQHFERQQDHFGIDCGIRLAQRLYSKLMELPQPSRLRSIVAEHRAHIKQLDQRRCRVEFVLKVRPNDRRGVLGAQRDRTITAIDERIHLFVDHVGALADPALK